MSKRHYLCRVDETPFIINASSYAQRLLLQGLRVEEKADICEWVESTVDLSFDATSSASGLIKLYPYQKEVLRAMDDPGVTDVTLEAGQRLGKSQCWKLALLKHIHDGGCSAVIVYPSLELGERTNRDTLQPLLKTLPAVAQDFAVKTNILRTSYHVPSCSSIIYFLGGGSQVVSYTANFAVLDESDFVELRNSDAEDAQMSQSRALRLRMQTFAEKKFITCSSPTLFGGVVHQAWKRGSMGTWHLRCLHCGELSPANKLAFYSDQGWRGLQWSKDGNGDIIEDSIRWICPHCGHEHTEADALAMNEAGCYVHQKANATHKSYQVGALAQPLFWRWREIAQAQEDASNGDGDAKKYLANTICGLPYKHVRDGDKSQSIEAANEARKVDYPSDLAQRLTLVVAGIDRQSSDLEGRYFCSIVRGYCDDGTSYLLSAGFDNSMEEVKARISKTYYGLPVKLALIDNGGFTVTDVDPYVYQRCKNLYYYKGTSNNQLREDEDYKPAGGSRRMWLANATRYQVRLLEQLYTVQKAGWYIPHDVDPEYFKQLCNVRPGSANLKDGRSTEFQNWCSSHDARRDFFDSEKMALVAVDVACKYIPAQGFRLGHKPRFYVERELKRLARLKKHA